MAISYQDGTDAEVCALSLFLTPSGTETFNERQQLAVQAVDMLRDKIENGTQGYVHQILLPTLIKRGTCKELD